MANSWSKQPIWQGTGSNYLNSTNDSVIGGQITTVPNAYASAGNQTLPGDHIVLDEVAAAAAGNPALAALHGGYFQYVKLDPAMLLATGAINQTITVGTPGTGYAAATTVVTFSAAPAGGTTATGTAVVTSTGTISAIVVTNQGAGYTVAPTITITGAGASAAATATLVTANSPLIAGQALYWKNTGFSGTDVYTVTNIQTLNTGQFAGVLLNPSWTPGNYSWIQAAGRATGLLDATSATAVTPGVGLYLSASTGTSNASLTAIAGTATAFVGVAEGYAQASPVAGTTVLFDIQKQSLRF
jgi:hypothetical protein